MEEKTIQSFDGTGVFYKIKRQSGPFLILLHGGSGSSRSWLFQEPFLLEKGFSLIVLDQRGHGLSGRGKDLSFYQIDRFVEDVKTILDFEKIEQTVLIGHSFGSFVAQRFYQLYPARVKSLILISTKIKTTFSFTRFPVDLLMRTIFSLAKTGKPNSRYTDYYKFTNTFDLNPFRILSDIRCCSWKTYAATILWGNSFENQKYKEIGVKSLLIHGKKDIILPYKEIEKVASEKKNFELGLLSTNHITLLNTPDEINQLIGDFLTKP